MKLSLLKLRKVFNILSIAFDLIGIYIPIL